VVTQTATRGAKTGEVKYRGYNTDRRRNKGRFLGSHKGGDEFGLGSLRCDKNGGRTTGKNIPKSKRKKQHRIGEKKGTEGVRRSEKKKGRGLFSADARAVNPQIGGNTSTSEGWETERNSASKHVGQSREKKTQGKGEGSGQAGGEQGPGGGRILKRVSKKS